MSSPKLIVFDLDYTLWPFWCDTHVAPPLRPDEEGRSVVDKYGDYFKFYKEVPAIFRMLKENDIPVCIASRTHTPRVAQNLLNLLKIDGEPASSFIAYTAWGTSSKVRHLEELHHHTGINYSDMILFDDEAPNRSVEWELGATFVLVSEGLTLKVYEEGVERWQQRHEQPNSKTHKGE